MHRLLRSKFVHLTFGGVTSGCLLLVNNAGNDGLPERTVGIDESFRLPLVQGSEMTAADVLSGDARLIIFSALDCVPCDGIFPYLERFGSSTLLVFVVPDIGSDGSRVRALIEDRGVTQPVGLMSVVDAREVFDVTAYPMALHIDRRGKVIGEAKGVGTMLQLSTRAARPGSGQLIEKLLRL